MTAFFLSTSRMRWYLVWLYLIFLQSVLEIHCQTQKLRRSLGSNATGSDIANVTISGEPALNRLCVVGLYPPWTGTLGKKGANQTSLEANVKETSIRVACSTSLLLKLEYMNTLLGYLQEICKLQQGMINARRSKWITASASYGTVSATASSVAYGKPINALLVSEIFIRLTSGPTVPGTLLGKVDIEFGKTFSFASISVSNLADNVPRYSFSQMLSDIPAGDQFQLNSDVISLAINPAQEVLYDFLTLTFQLVQLSQKATHYCVRLNYNSVLSFYSLSPKSCSIYSQNLTHVVCRCRSIGIHTIITMIPGENPSETVVNLSSGLFHILIFSLVILLMIISIVISLKTGAWCRPHSFTYVCLDATLILRSAVLISGLYTTAYAPHWNCIVITVCQYSHVSILCWILAEALLVLTELKRWTNTTGLDSSFLLKSIGWFLPVGIGGSVISYDFDVSQDVSLLWPYSSGVGCLYLIGPIAVLVLVILLLEFTWNRIMFRTSLPAHSTDFQYARSFLTRHISHLILTVLVWFLGFLAVYSKHSRMASIAFFSFYILESFFVFCIHCLDNMDMRIFRESLGEVVGPPQSTLRKRLFFWRKVQLHTSETTCLDLNETEPSVSCIVVAPEEEGSQQFVEHSF